MTDSYVQICGPGEYLSDRWHEVRMAGVSASEIAAILGLSPWSSSWELWHRKRGLLEPWQGNDATHWGSRLERVIADEFASRHPEFEAGQAGLCQSLWRPWQLATPDRVLMDAEGFHEDLDFDHALVAALECKTTDSWDGWGDEGTGDIPVHYRTQVLWQADVLGVRVVYVAALARGKDYREYEVVIDDDARADLEIMRQAAQDFLALTEPPPLDAHAATTRALKELHPDVEDIDVEVPENLVSEYAEVREQFESADRRKAEVENQLRDHIGDGRRGVFDGHTVVTRSVFERTGLDTAALKRDHPDIAAKYATSTTVSSLRAAPKTKKETKIA